MPSCCWNADWAGVLVDRRHVVQRDGRDPILGRDRRRLGLVDARRQAQGLSVFGDLFLERELQSVKPVRKREGNDSCPTRILDRDGLPVRCEREGAGVDRGHDRAVLDVGLVSDFGAGLGDGFRDRHPGPGREHTHQKCRSRNETTQLHSIPLRFQPHPLLNSNLRL